ncbi:MAG: phage protein Gp27 family protein [Phycisphaerae bacterium]
MAKDRRVHSVIDKLPADLRETLTRMIVDNYWPGDFPFGKGFGFGDAAEEPKGNPRYEDLVTYCVSKGYSVSLSSVGRFGKRMRILARMKQAGAITREIMADINAEKASATQKAVAEMITATTIEFITDHDDFSAKELRDVAIAMKDCTAIAINADKYTREQLDGKIQKAAASTKETLTKANVDRKLIQEIIDEHLGVVKS